MSDNEIASYPLLGVWFGAGLDAQKAIQKLRHRYARHRSKRVGAQVSRPIIIEHAERKMLNKLLHQLQVTLV